MKNYHLVSEARGIVGGFSEGQILDWCRFRSIEALAKFPRTQDNHNILLALDEIIRCGDSSFKIQEITTLLNKIPFNGEINPIIYLCFGVMSAFYPKYDAETRAIFTYSALKGV